MVKRALLAMLGLLIIVDVIGRYSQANYAASLHDEAVIADRLADIFPGFSCHDIEVASVRQPDSEIGYGGGSYLVMSDDCRQRLERMAAAMVGTESAPVCYSRGDTEMCLDEREVYFGANRPG